MTQEAELFSDCSQDEENVHQVRVDECYAKKYNSRKRKETLKELSKTVEEEQDTSEASSSTEEDSDAVLLTKEVQAQILNTITKIKKKDSSIYDPKKYFFEETLFDSQEATDQKKSSKPLTFSKFMTKTLTKEGSTAFLKDGSELKKIHGEKHVTNSFEEEQQKIKQEFLQAAYGDDDQEDDLLQEIDKTAEEKAEEEFTFREFLQKRAQTNKDESILLESYLHDDDTLNENQRFLRDYILFEGWKEGNKMPQGQSKTSSEDLVNEEEHEAYTKKANQFEALYNFRYEEKPCGTIEGHARQIFDSLRQKEEKRRRQRMERKEKKALEKREKQAELERLKQLKKEELLERLKAIQLVSGRSTALNFDDINLDGEFNEKEHEKQMNAILGENYEEQVENDLQGLEHSKTVLDALIELGAPPKNLSAKQKRKLEKLRRKNLKLHQELNNDDEPYAPLPEEPSQKSKDFLEESYSDGRQVFFQEVNLHEENLEDNHLWYLCDGCQYGIPSGKKRYECSECEDFVLCQRCFQSLPHRHRLKQRRVASHCKPPEEFIFKRETESLKADILQSQEIKKALDEYYALNYEDIVGGIPVRFKYTETPKIDFGLSTQDILNQSDAQLNQRVSLKKLAPFRTFPGKAHFKSTLKAFKRQPKSQKKQKNVATKIKDEIPEDRLAAYGLISNKIK